MELSAELTLQPKRVALSAGTFKDSAMYVDQLGGPVPRPPPARELKPVMKSVQEKQPKERLLKRLVKLAKGDAGVHELSSYANYEKVAKGVRKLASPDEPGKGQKDRANANATLTSPARLVSPHGRQVSFESESLQQQQDHVLQQTAAINNLQVSVGQL